MQWAFEQNNLRDVHWNRGSYGGGNAEYQKAIEFFENAKQGFTEAAAGCTRLVFQPALPSLYAGHRGPACRSPEKDV